MFPIKFSVKHHNWNSVNTFCFVAAVECRFCWLYILRIRILWFFHRKFVRRLFHFEKQTMLPENKQLSWWVTIWYLAAYFRRSIFKNSLWKYLDKKRIAESVELQTIHLNILVEKLFIYTSSCLKWNLVSTSRVFILLKS